MQGVGGHIVCLVGNPRAKQHRFVFVVDLGMHRPDTKVLPPPPIPLGSFLELFHLQLSRPNGVPARYGELTFFNLAKMSTSISIDSPSIAIPSSHVPILLCSLTMTPSPFLGPYAIRGLCHESSGAFLIAPKKAPLPLVHLLLYVYLHRPS